MLGISAIAMAAMALVGCGAVVFVDPDADLKAALVIRDAERFVIDGDPRDYFHVRIGSRRSIDRIELAVEGSSGRHRLPLEDASTQLCGSDHETCLSLTLGPGLEPDLDRIVLSLAAIGHENTALLHTISLSATTMFAEAQNGNRSVAIALDDPIRRFFSTPETTVVGDDDGEAARSEAVLLFPRRFEAHSRPGSCTALIDLEDPGWTAVSRSSFSVDAAFSDGPDPLTCISLRPALPHLGPPVLSVTVPARAVVSTFTHVYAPVVETSPLLFVPLFDLELPNEARCSAAHNLVRSAVLEAATEIASEGGAAAQVLMLEPLLISVDGGVPCRQTNDRTFDARALAAAIDRAIDVAYGPDRRVRMVLVYATNLDLDLPPSLQGALNALRVSLSTGDPGRRDFLVAIAPVRPTAALSPDRTLPWIATEEPLFRDSIRSLFRQVWPFRTMVHTDRTVVPLLPESDRGRYAAYRICSASHEIMPLGNRSTPQSSALQIGPDGPAYRVPLGEQLLVDPTRFNAPRVVVEWQACEALCDRPAPRGDPSSTWSLTDGC